MTALAAAPPRLDMGRVVNRTFAAIGGNFGPFIVLAILLAALPAFLINLGSSYAVQAIVTGYDYQSITLLISAMQLASMLVTMIPTYILVGALTQGSIVFFNGGRASFGECLSTGLRFLLPLIGLGVCMAIGLILWSLPTAVGFYLVGAIIMTGGVGLAGPFIALLLVVLSLIPAVMALVRWMVASPALVAERIGIFAAFQRSGDLTRDTRWRVFWLVVIYFVIVLLIQWALRSLVIGVIMDRRGDPGILGWLVQGVILIVSALISMTGAAGTAAMYFDLRTAKEGVTSDELAKVFE